MVGDDLNRTGQSETNDQNRLHWEGDISMSELERGKVSSQAATQEQKLSRQ